MTEDNMQANLNDCSQHLSKFNCRECGMVSENFLVAHALLFIINSKLIVFIQNKITKKQTICIVSSDH